MSSEHKRVNINSNADFSISQSSILPSESTIENTDDTHFHEYDYDDKLDVPTVSFCCGEPQFVRKFKKLENQPQILQIRTTDQEKISDDDVTIINSIMKNVKLSDSAVPEWAKIIPEEAWLPVIINNSKDTPNSTNSTISKCCDLNTNNY
ncbi:20994_t:CDS:2 [Cetraspora pellucida]|uniref:20994_t:CDS:1 n=1 Tax=Cetraspora pellucida TaxID=1433469 RepID=A0A9N9G8Z4_9GLOM|nr:20994_t:CDS:2 [Cetraspora pellucida]